MSRRADRRLALVLLAPALVVLAAVTVYPSLWVLALALQRRVPVFGISRFVGLDHFRFLIGDDGFLNAVRVTVVFTLTSVAAEVVLGVLAALGLRHLRRPGLALTLLLLPWAVPGVVAARTFEWIYEPGVGIAGRVAATLGIGPVNWLGDPRIALAAVTVADVWRALPFVALLCYARLLTIPGDVYEAAAVDGASGVRAFSRITLPLLAPMLLVATLFRTLDALRAFDVFFVMTGGGPAGRTETLALHAYRSLFQTMQLGFGAAVATVVFAAVVVTAALYLHALERARRAA